MTDWPESVRLAELALQDDWSDLDRNDLKAAIRDLKMALGDQQRQIDDSQKQIAFTIEENERLKWRLEYERSVCVVVAAAQEAEVARLKGRRCDRCLSYPDCGIRWAYANYWNSGPPLPPDFGCIRWAERKEG